VGVLGERQERHHVEGVRIEIAVEENLVVPQDSLLLPPFEILHPRREHVLPQIRTVLRLASVRNRKRHRSVGAQLRIGLLRDGLRCGEGRGDKESERGFHGFRYLSRNANERWKRSRRSSESPKRKM